jgi:hypothetical protein
MAVTPGPTSVYSALMKDDPHLRELHAKRSFLVVVLEPLEDGRMASGATPANRARSHFIRREIAELDILIAREEGRPS